uniref:Ras-related protein Rab-21 n=1 Tax=Hirondellea gigas TaxID=1518452 RepID=A0A6A7GC11_9CRUS
MANRFKVVLLGEGRVGKTSILIRYIQNEYSSDRQSTVQASYLEKRLNIDSTSVRLAIWDTAGQERFHALGPIYYRDAHAALLVYDITDRQSFTKVQHWVKELRKIVGENIVLAIAANKCDLEKKSQVDWSDAEEYATSVGAQLFRTSAKSGKGLEQTFLEISKALLQKNASRPSNPSGRGGRRKNMLEDSTPIKSESSCCS